MCNAYYDTETGLFSLDEEGIGGGSLLGLAGRGGREATVRSADTRLGMDEVDVKARDCGWGEGGIGMLAGDGDGGAKAGELSAVRYDPEGVVGVGMSKYSIFGEAGGDGDDGRDGPDELCPNVSVSKPSVGGGGGGGRLGFGARLLAEDVLERGAEQDAVTGSVITS